MSEKTENPLAFPRVMAITPYGDWQIHDYGEQGMALRDYFAAAALQGFCANPQSDGSFGPKEPNDNDRRATNCYAVADAMLKARAA